MTQPNPAPADATPCKTARLEAGEAIKLSFWISQLFIIIATIAGVYLAANQGFKQALAYGDIQTAKNNYYLRKSLQNEMQANIAIVRDYLKRISSGAVSARRAPIKFETFIWDSLKYSPNTLETPPELLRANSIFLRQMSDYYESIATNDYSVEYGTKKIEALLTQLETEVLPKFESNTAEIKASLAKQNINL